MRTLRSALKPFDARAVKPQAKAAEPFYLSDAYRAWREQVIVRAGGRCEAIERGVRCTKAAPRHRMFADHIIERADGGGDLDPANGQCLCGRHHTLKTARARAARLRGEAAEGRGA